MVREECRRHGSGRTEPERCSAVRGRSDVRWFAPRAGVLPDGRWCRKAASAPTLRGPATRTIPAVPKTVKRFLRGTRMWNSAGWRSGSVAAMGSRKDRRQRILLPRHRALHHDPELLLARPPFHRIVEALNDPTNPSRPFSASPRAKGPPRCAARDALPPGGGGETVRRRPSPRSVAPRASLRRPWRPRWRGRAAGRPTGS